MKEFRKYPKIYVLGNEENKDIFLDSEDLIVIEEKLDGTNIRFLINNGKIIFGSRNRQLTSDEGEEINIDKNFKLILDYVKSILKDRNLTSYEGYIFFGEGMIKHSLDYDWDKIPRFVGFDIFDLKKGMFLCYKQSKKIFEELGFTFVPIIKELLVKEVLKLKMNDDFIPISEYAPKSKPKQQAEGIVFKNYKKQIFAKYVREKFKEVNKKTFGFNKKYTNNDDEKVVAIYCTNARIDKMIFKMIDEGKKLEMKLMSELPKRVYNDMFEENWREIIHTNYVVNFRNLRKMVSKRCLMVLKQVIVNNSLS